MWRQKPQPQEWVDGAYSYPLSLSMPVVWVLPKYKLCFFIGGLPAPWSYFRALHCAFDLVEEPFQRELKCLDIWQHAQKIIRQASFFVIFCITYGEGLLFAERWVVLFKFILLDRLEHRKNRTWGVETVQELGQTAYAGGETCPRTAHLNAQLKVSEFFQNCSWD